MTLLVGGIGWPYDDLVAAALTSPGREVRTIGRMDSDALERGRAALPRGQCSPMLFTTGALLRAAAARSGDGAAYLGLRSCGPCRYALFDAGWTRVLAAAGSDLSVVTAGQSTLDLAARLGSDGLLRALDALAVADALVEAGRRLAPSAVDPTDVDLRLQRLVGAVARRVSLGEPPLTALRAEAGGFGGLALREPEPLPRALLVGEPWSLHVDGDGQLNLPAVLARASVEVEAPPLVLWFSYLAWQARGAPWGAALAPSAATLALALAAEERVAVALAEACEALGVEGFAAPSMDELAALAAPHLAPSLRGGYGHMEVALALQAARDRRVHMVLSVKSFGCVPSAGVSDGILPAALRGRVAFLSLEVCPDGAAARESRLALRVAAARDLAEREASEARARCVGPATVRSTVSSLLRGFPGARPYACTLASEIASRRETTLHHDVPRSGAEAFP